MPAGSKGDISLNKLYSKIYFLKDNFRIGSIPLYPEEKKPEPEA
jgi:hypothetical protein